MGLFCALLLWTGSSAAQSTPTEAPILDSPVQPRLVDLDVIRESHVLRVLTTYNHTNFFLGDGGIHGFEYEMLTRYEKHLNRGRSRFDPPTTLVFIPVLKEQLIPLLLEGRGDLVAAGMTVTPQRSRQVSFTRPYLEDVSEMIVTHESIASLATLEDLLDYTIHVVAASSYQQHIEAINHRRRGTGHRPLTVQIMDPDLETEDILEMCNAGMLKVMVADRHLAQIWTRAFPEIRIHEQLTISKGGSLAWAVRPDNPLLLKDLNAFVAKNRKGSLLGNVLFERYFEDERWVTDPVSPENQQRFDEVRAVLEELCPQYGFDWQQLAAMAYQESGFDQSKKSHAGAVGVMQVRPSTARDMGFDDISTLRENMHAGVKYLAFVRDRYFSGAEISHESRMDFVFGAYNAGPRKIREAREHAEQAGRDPNLWFGNVEYSVLRTISREPVRYVANINKYYTALRLSMDR